MAQAHLQSSLGLADADGGELLSSAHADGDCSARGIRSAGRRGYLYHRRQRCFEKDARMQFMQCG